MSKAESVYNNEAISMLKGADRVRLRPSVIFGSDDIEGCTHGFFEILSNSTDEAKAGYGKRIEVKRFKDHSIEVKDFGRGVPLDWNEKEQQYNWSLIYCELYAGGKYDLDGNYKFSLGLNGLGACATQYASEYFDVTSVRDGYRYSVHFEKGENVGGLVKEETASRRTGTTQRWKPDIDVFTDIDIPLSAFQQIMKQQAIVNAGITYSLWDEESGERFEYLYPEGIAGYVDEINGESGLTEPYFIKGSGKGKDREDKAEYKVEAEIAFCFNNRNNLLQYFHNSSWLEYGGSPDRAVKSAFVSAFDREIKNRNKYTKNESKVSFGDIQDSLILVVNSFSTETSYENQTKKAINNKYIQEFLTELIKSKLEIWFIEHRVDGEKAIDQILINKRSRESAESQRITVKKKLMEKTDVTNKVKKFVDCRSKDPEERELFICLKGDTRIRLMNGSTPEIASLVGRKDFFGYSTDETGQVIPARIKEVFQTRCVNDMLKITFDDDSCVECTPEHLFMVQEQLAWVRADNLEVGQLMASTYCFELSNTCELTEVRSKQMRVKKAEKIHYEEKIPVYCLNIDTESHAFILENGIVTHNCEGDSAMGSLLTARNANFQALMPIRGKILNLEKASLQQVFQSDIILDLIRVLGCGIEVRGKKLPKDIPAFDIDKLKFNKIIAIADADVDGFHIVTLLSTMLYKLCPQLIERGYLYFAQTPLYEITYRNGKKEETLYAFTDAERNKLIAGKDPSKLKIQRSKGLGENDAKMQSLFMLPPTRRLIRVTAEEASTMAYWFGLLMGSEVGPRKAYIEEYGYLYMDDLDVS